MNLLNKLIALLLLVGLYVPSYAAVKDIDPGVCGVYSDDEKKGEKVKKKERKNLIVNSS